ncbi:Eco57I restriction-modification methylase domain-containing protein [Acetobacter ascendens]|uniref:site-specific DNA-methyltransferase (adenine-specific) n=1 Tax=Acetobacter ascendens TaxID=481146 RepID=A0A1Y0UYR1_9PROT|nr:Eco57I restriction-modification methylase domain-containing protein [Acetobacter ascendens]ARW10915.1 Site-specific DNA-methyltransferase (adenine-specific) [Acetobacter ascendens]
MAKINLATLLREPSLPDLCPVTEALDTMANAGIEKRGAIFTRREVVEFILDLVGYDASAPLHTFRLLEPSFGFGDFLLPSIDRLLIAWKRSGAALNSLIDAIRAVELHQASFDRTHALVVQKLRAAGVGLRDAQNLADQWLVQGDFLLMPISGKFDVVVGNPPYVRQELIPDVLMAEYRARYQTIYDRADIYIPFIERSLSLLEKKGQLGFICADRWMKNRYGGPLRAMVADGFHLSVYVDMVNTPAFHQDVVAYPAITIIGRERGAQTRIAHRPDISKSSLAQLAAILCSAQKPSSDSGVKELESFTSGSEPWIIESSDRLALVRKIESKFPLIEDVGCKVGIGVATGADKAFIGEFDGLDVEACRKLPLVMTRDIMDGYVKWRGLGVVNPFGDDGKLVKLDQFPKLKRYLNARRDQIAARHVARKAPENWYRTIDRIYPELVCKPKLLIPDIKGAPHIVYEEGSLYPHHNLYFITSDTWEMRALQAVLLSGIARLFVATYSTRMRGGYLRFQAQYLRRIRLPDWKDVSPKMRQALEKAAKAGDAEACNKLAFELYGLSVQDRVTLEGDEK